MARSDFMPYGAPELLEGAEARVARSTMLASGLVALLVFCSGLVLATRSIPVVVDIPFDPTKLLNPPVQYVPRPERAEPVPVTHHELSVPVPVPDAPPIEPARPELPFAEGTAKPVIGEPDMADHARTGAGREPADPLPNVYVYTDELPQKVQCTPPVYPDLPRQAGVEGTVKLLLLIGLDGRVQRAIVRPGGSVPMLDDAAIAAAMTCVFTPALANGRPVKVWVGQDYQFKLH